MTPPIQPLSLSRAILESQHVRARVLSRVFAAAAIALGVGQGVQYVTRGSTWVPGVVLPFVVTMALLQVGMERFVRDRIRAGRDVAERFWVVGSIAEITLITGAIAAIAVSFDEPAQALVVPAVFVYFIFIIFSTLRLEPRISLVTGGMAAAQYFALSVILVALSDTAVLHPIIGSPFPYVVKTLLLLGGGVGAGFVAGELRRRLEATIAAQLERDRVERADRAKTHFLAHMSHEIRAPLNAVLGYAQILRKDATLSEDQRHAVATIDASGEHLLAVVNQVLDLSRIEAGRQELDLRPFRLLPLLNDLSAMFELRCRQKSLTWTLSTPGLAPEDGPVAGDPDRLRQILINLLENAVTATPAGRVRLEMERADETYRFHVIDSGPGIPPEHQATIFEPFRQVATPATGDGGAADAGAAAGSRRGSGAGLGLAIARAQTELMGGALSVTASSVEGSRFTLELRLPAALDAEESESGSLRLAAGVSLSALVVDDRAVDRAVLTSFLRDLGADVREAAHAEDALAALRERRPDVAFVDIRMPDTDGPALLARARTEGLLEGCHVVAVSASVLAHEREAILDAGFDVFLPKPIRADQLPGVLVEVPGLRFESAPDPGGDDATVPAVHLDGRAARPRPIPRELWLELRAAAESYSITDLKRGLDALAELGDEVAPLVAELQGLSRSYDMERIVERLDEVPDA